MRDLPWSKTRVFACAATTIGRSSCRRCSCSICPDCYRVPATQPTALPCSCDGGTLARAAKASARRRSRRKAGDGGSWRWNRHIKAATILVFSVWLSGKKRRAERPGAAKIFSVKGTLGPPAPAFPRHERRWPKDRAGSGRFRKPRSSRIRPTVEQAPLLFAVGRICNQRFCSLLDRRRHRRFIPKKFPGDQARQRRTSRIVRPGTAQ